MIKNLSISGFRGFGELQNIQFAMPDGQNAGSGLTIITGANNAGKTTIVESIRAFNSDNSPSFSEGKRNIQTGGKVELKLIDDTGEEHTIASINSGGSSSQKNKKFRFQAYIVQARRAVPFKFGKTIGTRDSYVSSGHQLEAERNPYLNSFQERIFQIEAQKDEFDKILKRVLGRDFQWSIEQRDDGNYYIKYINNGIMHSSEGIGDGIWSIFTICAAFFDAPQKSVIVIDEPELSLHPALQKRLMALLIEYARIHQIIICTHSPYFINWEVIISGAQLIRVIKDGINSKCYNISDRCRGKFKDILQDLNNPHVLGLSANEVFFLEDNIILVEGQEDVVIFNKIAKDINKELNGNFFGWGVGGAPKMEVFLMLFKDLGYRHIVVILDGDKAREAEKLENDFSLNHYKFITLKEEDIRDKESKNIPEKTGITDRRGNIKKEYQEYINGMFNEINEYFNK